MNAPYLERFSYCGGDFWLAVIVITCLICENFNKLFYGKRFTNEKGYFNCNIEIAPKGSVPTSLQ